MKKIIITAVILLVFSCFAYARINFLGFIRPLTSNGGGGGPACGSPVVVNTSDYITVGGSNDYVCVD